MKQNFKQALTDAFYAPPPARKSAFLKRHRRRELSRRELLALQIRYIPWWIWAASLLLSGFILSSIAWPVKHTLWYAAALTPFLALLLITENGRSQLYCMDELELACRVSRQSTLLARMVVLGLFHLILLGALAPSLAARGAAGTVQAGIYLLTPYLLTAALGMELSRRLRGRDGLLACGGAAALISGLNFSAEHHIPVLHHPDTNRMWAAALTISLAAVAAEYILYFRKPRDLQWN